MGASESRLIIDLVRSLAKSRNESMIIIDHNFAHLFEAPRQGQRDAGRPHHHRPAHQGQPRSKS